MNIRKNRLKLLFDRALSHSLLKQGLILLIVLVCAFILSFLLLSLSFDNWKLVAESYCIPQFIFPLLLLIDPNLLNSLYFDADIYDKYILIVSGIIYILGLFIFNGAIISLLSSYISHRVDAHRQGYIHYLRKGHTIIMGYDKMVASIIFDILAQDANADILLLTSWDVEKVREQLRKTFNEKQLKHLIINYGHRVAKDYYTDIHPETAKEIFIVGNRQRKEHDAINIECVQSLCNYFNELPHKQVPKRLTCVFENLDTYSAFKTTEIFEEVGTLGIEFIPYNFYIGWAHQVFINQYYRSKVNPFQRISYPSVYGQGISKDDKHFVHLVFVGTSNFAVAFAMEAAHILHFPNFASNNKRTRITFIDKNDEMQEFRTRNRHLFEIQQCYYQNLEQGVCQIIPPTYNGTNNFLDVEFEFIQADIFDTNTQDLLRNWVLDKENRYLSLFLAMADESKNFAIGMNMPNEVYDYNIPIFIRQDSSDYFVSNLRKSDEKYPSKKNVYYTKVVGNELFEDKERQHRGRYAHIYPFGMEAMSYVQDERIIQQAKLINYLYETADYSSNCFTDLTVLSTISNSTIWEKAQEKWSKLSVALRWSNMYCAYNMAVKLRSIQVMRNTADPVSDLAKDEIDMLAQVEHNRWNVEKLLMGYRKPLPEEDKYNTENKEFAKKLKNNKDFFIHHDLRPFSELAETTKQLDVELVKYIPWIMEMTSNVNN